MSSFVSDVAGTLEPSTSSPNEDASAGQRHDRVQNTQQGTMASPSTQDISTTQRMISATWGSILTVLLTTPLDVVRVRLQSQGSTPSPLNLSKFPAYAANFKELPPNLGVTACCKEVFFVGNNGDFCLAGNGTTSASATADCAVEETQRRTFNSTLDAIRKIAKNEGSTTLWRGLTPTLAMAVPGNIIYFTGYDWMRYSQASPIRRVASDAYAPLVAGSVARVAAGIVVSPIEMFRTRMQATAGHATNVFRDTFSGLRTMTQTQGYTSLWRGLTLTMWRDVPFSGFYWWGYEAIRNQLTDMRMVARGKELDPDRLMTSSRGAQNHETHGTTFVDSFLAGAGSGAVAAFATTPFDVGKTRQQVFRHAGDDGAVSAFKSGMKPGFVPPEERSMPRFLYHIFKEEGARGLFKGWVPRCLKVAPACAIMISSYEVGKRWAKSINEKKAATERKL